MVNILNVRDDLDEVMEITKLPTGETKEMTISIDEYKELISLRFKISIFMQIIERSCYLSEGEKAIYKALGGNVE